MTKKPILLILLFCFINTTYSQVGGRDTFDRYLTSQFNLFYSVSLDSANDMIPDLEKRVMDVLNDSNSFDCSFGSLSEVIRITISNDSLLRTFCWDKRGGGPWHFFATCAQYKTGRGKTKYQILDYEVEDGQETDELNISIYNIFNINIDNKPYYLLLGWWGHGGGIHTSSARIYSIEGDTFLLRDSMFMDESVLYANANRWNKINLQYDTSTQILSYNTYKMDEDTGFYKGKAKIAQWFFNGTKFVKKE